MNDIQIFNNSEFGAIRTVQINGDVYFVGKDIAEILGYSDTNKAIAMHVDVEDKILNDKSSSSFGQRGATLINESGLYSLILSSKLPKAKEFKHWVTSEILPTIRKHGAYMTEQTLEQALTSPDFNPDNLTFGEISSLRRYFKIEPERFVCGTLGVM